MCLQKDRTQGGHHWGPGAVDAETTAEVPNPKILPLEGFGAVVFGKREEVPNPKRSPDGCDAVDDRPPPGPPDMFELVAAEKVNPVERRAGCDVAALGIVEDPKSNRPLEDVEAVGTETALAPGKEPNPPKLTEGCEAVDDGAMAGTSSMLGVFAGDDLSIEPNKPPERCETVDVAVMVGTLDVFGVLSGADLGLAGTVETGPGAIDEAVFSFLTAGLLLVKENGPESKEARPSLSR